MSWTSEPDDLGSDLLADVPEGHRAGYVVLIGRPNVGKSTLVNALVGERVAPISPVPQTTRRRLLGILTRDDAQIVFVDTPGLHTPEQRLGQMMVEAADQALVDADLVLCVTDCTRAPGAEDQLAIDRAVACRVPKYLVVNKTDAGGATGFAEAFANTPGLDAVYRTSALTGEGLPELLAAVVAALPEAPPYFPADQITDAYEREVAAELIREAALTALQQELPHAVAIKVEEWSTRDNGLLYISALLVVERESQKGIVIGRQGRMLKTIGTRARTSLEGWLEQRVYLDLKVKVLPKWRKDEKALRWLGFTKGS